MLNEIWALHQADVGLNNVSAACKKSYPRYSGIIIHTLKYYLEDYINVEKAVDSQ